MACGLDHYCLLQPVQGRAVDECHEKFRDHYGCRNNHADDGHHTGRLLLVQNPAEGQANSAAADFVHHDVWQRADPDVSAAEKPAYSEYLLGDLAAGIDQRLQSLCHEVILRGAARRVGGIGYH
ncbi:hypothetical protein D3C81_1871330 [compost metagenome]